MNISFLYFCIKEDKTVLSDLSGDISDACDIVDLYTTIIANKTAIPAKLIPSLFRF